MGFYQAVDVIIEVVDDNVIERYIGRIPRNERIGGLVHLEQDLQDRHNQGKREDIQHGRKDVENHMQSQIPLVGRDEPAEYLNEFFHESHFNLPQRYEKSPEYQEYGGFFLN